MSRRPGAGGSGPFVFVRVSNVGLYTRRIVREGWLAGKDSNLRSRIQSPESYRWTTSQYLTIVSQNSVSRKTSVGWPAAGGSPGFVSATDSVGVVANSGGDIWTGSGRGWRNRPRAKSG